jgi:UDP-N-acetylmuramoyl-L-alanyl-D-glutamate--2,6-diaminopimelate ligase
MTRRRSAALEALKGAPGRLELGQRNGAPIFVDYAHKPDALESSARHFTAADKKRLIVVSGAAAIATVASAR